MDITKVPISSPTNIYGDYWISYAYHYASWWLAQKPGEMSWNLIKKNIQIHSGIMAEIKAQNSEGILLIVKLIQLIS